MSKIDNLIEYARKYNTLIYEYDEDGEETLSIYNRKDRSKFIGFDNRKILIGADIPGWSETQWSVEALKSIFDSRVEIEHFYGDTFVLVIYPLEEKYLDLGYSYIDLVSNIEEMSTFIELILDTIKE